MRPITSPLHPGDSGTEVANLQEGLALLLERQVIQAVPRLRQELLQAMSSEAHSQTYGSATRETVSIFQRLRQDSISV